MPTLRALRLLPPAALAALCAAAPAARLAAQPAAPAPGGLVVTAENATAADEARRGVPRAGGAARPGDVVHYRLAFTNPAAHPVRGVTLADPIPAGMRFVAGSARAGRADAAAEYSADGGRTWAARPVERVVVDGRAAERPVPAERYTHVRWAVAGPVAPRDRVVAEFDARLAPR